MTTDVVTMGEAMRLLVAEPGVALRRARTFRACVAGAESNVAVGLARLGHRVRFLSRVGGDSTGAAVLAILKAEDVDVSAVDVDPGGYTGILLRDSHPSREIDLQYHRAGSAAAGLTPEYVRATGLGNARLVHVSGITAMLSDSARAATAELLALARAEGATISFDPNIRRRLAAPERWRDTLAPLITQADLVFTGADELRLLGMTAEDLKSAQAVVVKHRDHSCLVVSAAGSWHLPTAATTVVDPVGAGDALVSGYLSAWLRGADPQTALRGGLTSAAGVVAGVTDIEGLPDLENR